MTTTHQLNASADIMGKCSMSDDWIPLVNSRICIQYEE